MLPDLALAIRLQALDRTISGLENEIATLPKHVAEIEKKLEAKLRRLEADRAALAANGRERKKLEGDIQAGEDKISKLKGQMSGAKTNEQYQAFQKEIAYAEGEIRKAEDKILDLMEGSESLDANVKSAEVALKKEQAEVANEKRGAEQRTAADRQDLTSRLSDRKTVQSEMDPGVYAMYERIRKKTKNPIAEATDGRCSACQIALRPQFFQDLRKGDKIMQCESCGRILVYNPVIDIRSDVAASQQTA